MTSAVRTLGDEATLPTLRGLEHISMTVPDLEEATAFFAEMFGCQTMYTMGPFSAVTGGAKGSFMRVYANADVRAVVENVRVLRSPFLNVELFQARSPTQRTSWPDLRDVGGWQLSAGVDDVDAAVAFAAVRQVRAMGDGRFMTPWGLRFEIVPAGNQFCALASGTGDSFTPRGGMPTFRGFGAVAMTVPDLDEATQVFVELLGATPGDETGTSRVLQGSCLDYRLVEASKQDGHDPLWRGMLDIGGWHLAFYVDDVDAALDHLATLDLHVLGGKKPAYLYEAGDEAYTVHCLTPFGFYFELVTYPSGRYRTEEYAVPAWHPGS